MADWQNTAAAGQALPEATAGRDEIRASSLETVLRTLTHGLFGLCLILALATHSSYWRTGPFTWLTVLRLPPLSEAGWSRVGSLAGTEIGLLTLLPVLLAGSWLALRLVERRHEVPLQSGVEGLGRRWWWGWPGMTWPLAGITALSLLSLAAPPLAAPRSLTANAAFQLLSLALAWFVYLFVVNEAPPLRWPLAVVVVVQGAAGLAQFVLQRDLGLAALGELPLNPDVRGISVLIDEATGERWLRAYGLTGHPNLLGTLLAVLLLILLPEIHAARGWQRAALVAAWGVGLAGLVATVSRAAWLGFALGLVVWAASFWQERRSREQGSGDQVSGATGHEVPKRSGVEVSGDAGVAGAAGSSAARQEQAEVSRDVKGWRPQGRHARPQVGIGLAFAVLALALLGFGVVYRDMILSRFFNLQTAVEARSLFERRRDVGIALQLISGHPLRGVGLGQYLAAARPVDPGAKTVHNVPLLVAAELGLPAALLWLWLGLAPIGRAAQDWTRRRYATAGYLAPWLALAVISMFQIMPWISTGWRTTTLFALAAGAWALALQPGRCAPNR